MSSFMEVGIDWITCSGKMEESSAEACRIMTALAGDEKVHDSVFYGYIGWRQGHLFYGEKEPRWLAQITGYVAADNWRSIFAISDNCSRMDLQMTVHYEAGVDEMVQFEYDHAHNVRAQRLVYPKIVMIKGDPTGDTFYMGDRSSDYFLRMYDKGAQSAMPEYAETLRYELEVKGKRAVLVGKALLTAEDEQRAIAGYIQAYLHSHGLFPPLPPMRSFYVEPRRIVAIPDERRLEWLLKQVSPTVQRLVARGRGADVLQALGITQRDADDTPLGS